MLADGAKRGREGEAVEEDGAVSSKKAKGMNGGTSADATSPSGVFQRWHRFYIVAILTSYCGSTPQPNRRPRFKRNFPLEASSKFSGPILSLKTIPSSAESLATRQSQVPKLRELIL